MFQIIIKEWLLPSAGHRVVDLPPAPPSHFEKRPLLYLGLQMEKLRHILPRRLGQHAEEAAASLPPTNQDHRVGGCFLREHPG